MKLVNETEFTRPRPSLRMSPTFRAVVGVVCLLVVVLAISVGEADAREIVKVVSLK